MNNGDDKDRGKIEFIIEHMAQLTVRQEGLVHRQEELTAKQQQTDEIVSRLATASLKRFGSLETATEALVDAQIKTEDRVQELARDMKSLVDAQIKTEDRMQELARDMKSLVNVFERFIDRENGGDNGEA